MSKSILPIRPLDFMPNPQNAGMKITLQHLVRHVFHPAAMAVSIRRVLRLGSSASDHGH